ncbi:GFA family protein [Rhizobium sp. PL01]|uniref:GFA family protein n=1 Tax=Rhizobium sp. PL01 TaxID=3085631 RepID=UPI002980CEE2|nr:GFA family protein [Rhizobium sp. PL01]MDW5316612.1 GFA family protein [Rhizobium sp. PL01]
MSKVTIPQEGGCRCGQVRLKISAQPFLTMACHCTGCQKMSSSAYSLSAAIPAEGFEVIAGEPVIGGLHGADRHYFCPHCMTWMFTRPQGMDWFVNLRATMLDDTSGVSPFVETFTSEKLAFAETGAVHSYETFPPMEAFEGLMQEFAARAASA